MSNKTIGDAVREHAKDDGGSTDDGIRYLELDGAITAGAINGAANLYLAALSIIREQDRRLTERSNGPKGDAWAQEYHLKTSALYAERDKLVTVLRDVCRPIHDRIPGSADTWEVISGILDAIAKHESVIGPLYATHAPMITQEKT